MQERSWFYPCMFENQPFEARLRERLAGSLRCTLVRLGREVFREFILATL